MKKLIFSIFLFVSAIANAEITTNSCLNDLANNPNFKYISSKVVIAEDGQSASLDILSNNQKPSPSEQKVLIKWDKARKDCYAAGNEHRRSYSPLVLSAFKNLFNDQDKLLGDLYLGKITYGQYAKSRKDTQQKYMRKFGKIKSDEASNPQNTRQEKHQQESQKINHQANDNEKKNDFIDCEKLDSFFDRFNCRGEANKRQKALVKIDTFKAKCDSMGFQRGSNEYSQCMLKMDQQENANAEAEAQRNNDLQRTQSDFGSNNHCRSTVNGNQVNTNCY